MENEQNTTNPAENENKPHGEAENQKSNYTSLSGDEPVSPARSQRKSDLQNTEDEADIDDISGDLSGNASGNSDAEEQ